MLLRSSLPYSWSNVKLNRIKTPQNGTIGAPPSPGLGWKIKPACLRWVCKCINSQGQITESQMYGGPTVNNISLSDLNLYIDRVFGPETSPGVYVYTIEFFGWYRKFGGWIGRDNLYNIYKRKI